MSYRSVLLRHLCLSIWLVLGGLSFQAIANERYADTVTVVEGQTRLMRYPGVMRVSIGHPDIANAQATGPDEVLLTGLKAGITDLRIWTDVGRQIRYQLKVIDTSWVQILEIINIVLADVEGVTAREENGIVFVEGRVLRDHDVAIIEDLRTRLNKEVSAGNVVFSVVKPSVSLKAMIMMDVQVVEVRRNDLNRLGVQWQGFYPGPYAVLSKGKSLVLTAAEAEDQATQIASGFGINSSFKSAINALISEGVIRVLAQPKLVSKSGTRAEFLAGGEIPIPLILDDKINVEFKQVGVILNIEPVADPDGFIATKVDVEVSQIDRSVTVLGIPGFTVNKTTMELNVQSGQTMVISGMLKAEDAKAVEKVPGLGQIPVLGELFKSRDFQQGTTELVVFVTPYLVNPESPWNQDMLQYTRDLAGQSKQDVESWSLWD